LPQLEELVVDGEEIPKAVNISTIPFENIIDDHNHLTFGKFMRRYGFKAAYAFVFIICKWADDNNFKNVVSCPGGKKAVDPVGGYTVKMLQKYYNVFLDRSK
jgi:hypothetical protein